ncbi:MAG TPA: rod shape-determining protein RodA [Candidatus Binatia bacterium]|nr:rod shape-determining protein RodA [Candidatus Binatia bacterium]
MGVLRAEPARFADVAGRSVAAVWRSYDVQLTVYAVLLTAVGLIMAYTNSVEDGRLVLGPESTFARGLLWAAIAAVVYVVATLFDYRWLKTLRWPVYLANLGLLVLTLAVGTGVGGTSRWVVVGPLVFQFSELAKVLVVGVLAAYLAGRQDRLGSLWTILGAVVLVGPPLLLVMLQPDLGTSLVFGAILAGMLFLGGASLTWLGVLGGAFLASLPIIWNHVLLDYQRERILSFLDPASDPLGSGYQLYQAQIAVGSGGLLGKGLTNGTQNQLDFLPVQTTDFVFAILAEELGFVGGVVVLVLYAALIWRVLVAGWRARDPFGTAFAAGVASILLFQVLVNIGMVVGIMPVTGIPLPFITHGGASLTSLALALGILQSVTIRQSRADW